MNEHEAQLMLKAWQNALNITNKTGIPLQLDKDEIEQIIIMIRSYLMTFEKGGYPFD